MKNFAGAAGALGLLCLLGGMACAQGHTADAGAKPGKAHGSYFIDPFRLNHTLSGYLIGLTLAQMVPEKSAEILQRAHDYAHNRMVCGVHTASDLEASRLMQSSGAWWRGPRFQQELQAARAETRHALGLN